MWISCNIKPFFCPNHIIDSEAFMSRRVLTYTPNIGYRMSIWYKTFDLNWNDWIDSDDSMGQFKHQPTHWMSIDSIINEWNDIENLPKENGQYLVWYPRLQEETQFVILYFNNGVWYDADEQYPMPEHCQPVLWMHPPKPPVL